MNGNAELLNFIYQNSQMGVDTLDQLIPMIEEGDFRDCVKGQWEQYKKIHQQAKEMLNKNGYDKKGISSFDKVKTYLMINLQTLTDKSVSHLAEMLIIGSNMGVVQAIKNMRKYQGAEEDILQLMKVLQKFEEGSMEQLKQFL